MKLYFYLVLLLGVPFLLNAEPLVTTLPEVVVTAEGEVVSSLTSPTLQTRREEFAKIPGAVEIIDSDSYKRGRSTTLRDALDYAPGVFVQSRHGAEESRVSIRGSGIQRTFHGRGIALLQDGMPLNQADGSFDFQSIEPLSARNIEVYRGANALEYGSTTLGGALNFESFTGYDASPFTARAEYGSYNSFRSQLSSGMVSGPFDYYISLTQGYTDGYREQSRQANFRLFSNLGYKISENLETRFYFTYVHTDTELPGNLTKEEAVEHPRRANPINVINNWKRNYDLTRLANKTVWEEGDQRVELTSFWSYKDLHHPIYLVLDQISHDFGFMAKYTNSGDLFGQENQFILGSNTTFGFLRDKRYINVLGENGFQVSDNKQYSFNTSLYLQDSFHLTDSLALVVGSPVTFSRRENRDQFPATPTDPDHSGSKDYWGFSPRIGMVYEITPASQAFFNVSRSFEPPTFGELGNPANGGAGMLPLSAQTATTVELGTRGNHDRVRWDLSWYYSWLDNELMEYEVLPGLTQTINAGRTLHHGVELGLDIDLAKGLFYHGIESDKNSVDWNAEERTSDRIVLKQVGLYNDFHFKQDSEYGNNRIAGIPTYYYRAELLYEHPSGFYVGPNVEWIPAGYYIDSANTAKTSPYALLGFKIGYQQPKKGFSTYLEVRNLLDKHYTASTGVVSKLTSANAAQFLPGDGASVYVGFEWKW